MRIKRYAFIALALALVVVANVVMVTAQEPEPVEILELRDRNSKTFSLGGDKYALDVSISSLHYKDDPDDPEELWKDIDTAITSSPRPEWEWEVVKGNWHLLINDDTTVALGKSGHWIGFRYMSFGYLDWSSKDYAILQHRQPVSPVIQDNRITWDGIFLGATLEYVYTPDGFKENLYISQTTRDWLTANPPSSYGLDNASSYLVGVLQCEWASSYQAETADGTPINWENVNEFVESGVFWRHPIKDKIVTALPIGWAHHADDPESAVDIRYRFFHQDGTHYLLFGAKVLDLNAMPPGTITLDPTINQQITDEAHDGYGDSGGSFFTATTIVGNAFDGDNIRSFFYFDNVTISNGATIDVAYVTIYTYFVNGAGGDCDIHAEDASDPAVPTSKADLFSRTPTTEYNTWNNIPDQDDWINSPSLVDVIQELVDSYDYSGGDHAVHVLFIDAETGAQGDRTYLKDPSDSLGPYLYIEYSTGAAAGYSWGEIIG